MPASGSLLVVLAPFLAAVALVVKASDGGPVKYRQVRVGRDGTPFRLHKFRTMVPNADALELQLRAEHSDPGSILFKMTDDPRITRPGHFLRRYSIDELPQLWNVFRGEMSLVGPRPALPHEVALMSEEERLRLRVRPGLSGLWQVSGRANLSRDDASRLDLYYVENWSMMQDIIILIRTVRAVLRADGAY
ncbi:MAG: sugar transferase [Actinobacteria bacterium]|nr:sugar transferase [Actinomycetota bacterium]